MRAAAGHVGSIYPSIPDVESARAVVPITGVDGMGKVLPLSRPARVPPRLVRRPAALLRRRGA
jgi:hypothetical protein